MLTSGKWGYIDQTGSYVINPQFDFANQFSEGAAVVALGGKCGLIDETGAYIVNPMYANLAIGASNGLLWFADDNGKLGYIDTTGKEVIPAQFDYLWDYGYGLSQAGFFYDDGYTVVRLGERFGIIDTTGKYVVNPQFDGIAEYQIY